MARSFASEGQKKTAVAALRMTEWNVLTQSCGNRAVLGVDDLGLHLDPSRQSLLRTLLGSMGQVFVTLPELPTWAEFKEARKFHVSAGQVLAQHP
jgi:DNA replication and repair protein RecF